MNSFEKAAMGLGVLAFLVISYEILTGQRYQSGSRSRGKLGKNRKQTDSERIAAAALAKCEKDVPPTSLEEKAKYYRDQIALGEALLPKGESAYPEAAVHFYRALRTYPIGQAAAFQNVIPPRLLQIVTDMAQLNRENTQEKYNELFPPKNMNVYISGVDEIAQPDGSRVVRQALVATKSFRAGNVIFNEAPVTSALYPSLESESFCSHCQKWIAFSEPSRFCEQCGEKTRFCSESCHKEAKSQYHTLLCVGDYSQKDAKTHDLVKLAKDAGVATPTVIARFLAQALQSEQKQTEKTKPETEYSVWEHLELLNYLDLHLEERDRKLLTLLLELFEPKYPGIREFITEKRFATLKGYILYNDIAITLADNKDVKGISDNKEGGRYDGINQRIGIGLYRFAGYLSHSCDPNCAIRFQSEKRGNELSLVALRPIARDEQLSITFVENGTDKLLAQRREQLTKNWQFKCACDRCILEEGGVGTNRKKDTQTAVAAAATGSNVDSGRDPNIYSTTKTNSSAIGDSTYTETVVDEYQELTEEEYQAALARGEKLELTTEEEYNNAKTRGLVTK